MNARSPSSPKKASGATQAGSRKEFRAFLIRIALAPGFTFLQTSTRSGLSALGRIAAQVWVDLGTQNGLRIDAVVFRKDELEGLLFLPVPLDSEPKVGLALRLLKARIVRAAAKPGWVATALWKRAYQAELLTTRQEIASVRRRILRESKSIKAPVE